MYITKPNSLIFNSMNLLSNEFDENGLDEWGGSYKNLSCHFCIIHYWRIVFLLDMDDRHQNCDESAFLFGSKKIRCYGSIADLNSQTTSAPKFLRIAVHKVQPNDTLQNLELRYNSSMFEIKRINRLWSNQSLYCKTEVFIPIFTENITEPEENNSLCFGPEIYKNKSISKLHDNLNKMPSNGGDSEESLDQLLKRIDVSMRNTKSAIGRFDKIKDKFSGL
ncbi:LysM domain-containing protein [Meloidogyne graminicola]|uniref:LysM domain-containing protein n=1 Tax=Meloidogyne graminicola TaxID=189291 RepID=A0A8S9ZT33_9BILA|nr:LysM domain-containing protein [Meloidogyne graminicola]